MCKMVQEKILVAFDFDHTLIDENSDIYVQRLAPDGKIPPEIKALYNEKGWTKFMGDVFAYIHKHGKTAQDIESCMHEMKYVDGVKELLSHLCTDRYEVIIISDSNSILIDNSLQGANITSVFKAVYTNPAEYDSSGCLSLSYFHHNDWCNLSTQNLCKGRILEDHIADARKRGVSFPVVAYVGDGSNDLCPSLKLTRSTDLLFARKGFSLLKKVEKLEPGKFIAKVVPWTTGREIQKELERIKLQNDRQ